MPEPLPLADLLASLRDQGLPAGVREHLVVGRLLARWDGTEVSSLRGALGAVLARNPEEVRIVHATFDQLYGAPEVEPSPNPREVSKPARRKLRWGWIAGVTAAVLALVVVAGAIFWPREIPDPPPIPPKEGEIPAKAPPPPVMPRTVQVTDWGRSFTAAAGAATGLFLWLFRVRLRREGRQRGRETMVEAADALPGPYRYEISLNGLAPPFSRELLDDVAGLLGRRITAPPRQGDLDVERTLARTLRAGLAPQIVFRARTSAHPILVLEDTGGEMRPWRRRVSALLDGLENRGVPIERWRFHADAGRVSRNPGEAPQTLKQLFRLRAESPLLVVSAGEGLLEEIDGRLAPWVEALRGWRHRAWLHPVTDSGYWRPALGAVPIHAWPMTPEGVMAAARQLLHGETGRPMRESTRSLSWRRVQPLDVERLRWLLTLAPRRDPDLAELLRQRFCPQVPPAALLEALDAPPLLAWPGVGPTAEEVHTFLAALLAASEPPSGTAAHERWRLDRALQEIRVPGREEPAVRELAELAQGPLAAEVVSTVERWTGRPERRLRQRVLRDAFTRADREGERQSGWRWIWPDLTEMAVALACLGLLGALLPSLSSGFERETPVTLEKVFRLREGLTYSGLAVLEMTVIPGTAAPRMAKLYKDGRTSRSIDLASRSASFQVPTGHWYDLRATSGRGRLAISEAPLWVPAPPSTPIPPPPLPGGAANDGQPSDLEAADVVSGSQAPADVASDVAQRRRYNPSIESIKPDSGSPGETLDLYIVGTDFDPETRVGFSPADGITVSACRIAATTITCQVEIAPDAAPGERQVAFGYPDRKGATFTVLDQPSAAQ